MKSMQIYEPAMCCSTGLCGVGVDPELLRISTVLNTLEKNGAKVERYNLSNSPQEFIRNKSVNSIIKAQGTEVLPLTVLDGEIIITGRYPTNDEFVKHLNVPESLVGELPKEVKAEAVSESGCCCSDGDCTEGDCSDGDCSEGDCSEGDCSEGDCSDGDCSEGDCSDGDCSAVDCSEGNCSEGCC